MNMKDEKFDEFDIDPETADRIAKEYPSLSDSARERMFNIIENKMNVTNKDEADTSCSVPVVEKKNRPGWIMFAGMAAVVAVIAGTIGGGNYLHRKLNDPDPVVSTVTESEPASIQTSVTEPAISQSSVTKQTSVSPVIVKETVIGSSFATGTASESSVTTSTAETSATPAASAPPETSAAPQPEGIRCDRINLPGDFYNYIKARRTADGFGCIGYNQNHQLAYLHISEDMQTSEAFVLTPPDHGDYDVLRYQCYAFDNDGVWAIVNRESHDGPEPEGGRSYLNYDEYEIWDNSREDHYLLCHYAGDGTLISSVPLDGFQNSESYDFQDSDFESAGDVLYLMSRYKKKIFRISKETAEVSFVLEPESEKGIEKNLFFDRDGKPVLLRETVQNVPDSTYIYNASVFEFDPASGSLGQTLYSTADGWQLVSYSISGPEFRVVKGCGQYRLFVSTGSEFIGIRDNGEQELIFDFDSDFVNNSTIIDCLKTKYYEGHIKNIEILPVDDTHFLGLISLPGGLIDRPAESPIIYAFRLTPR
ncbi:MAG: hypothetical protein J6W65_03845 [Oscillospiraceae bacterium]|nr:hypothetical protein [Oscillospiraceae bacterium]